MPISQQDYDMMQARIYRAASKASHADAVGKEVEKESELHNAIIKHCRENGWIYFHGSMAHKSHRTLGEPDFCCLLPAGRVLFIECKGKHTKISPEQLAMTAWMKKLGHSLHIVRGIEEFFCLLKEPAIHQTK